MANSNNEVGLLCEQGDMGLFYDPLNEADRKIYDEQRKKEEKDKKSNSATTNGGQK